MVTESAKHKLRHAWVFQVSVPTQIGAVNDGGKGKKGNSKTTGGKGNDKSKNKSSDSGKNKERHGWNGSQQLAHFQGDCSPCSKWRHKRADCRTRLAQQNNGAVAGIQHPVAEGDGIKFRARERCRQ